VQNKAIGNEIPQCRLSQFPYVVVPALVDKIGFILHYFHKRRSRQFFEVQRTLPKFSQTCPKKLWAIFCANIFSWTR